MHTLCYMHTHTHSNAFSSRARQHIKSLMCTATYKTTFSVSCALFPLICPFFPTSIWFLLFHMLMKTTNVTYQHGNEHFYMWITHIHTQLAFSHMWKRNIAHKITFFCFVKFASSDMNSSSSHFSSWELFLHRKYKCSHVYYKHIHVYNLLRRLRTTWFRKKLNIWTVFCLILCFFLYFFI